MTTKRQNVVSKKDNEQLENLFDSGVAHTLIEKSNLRLLRDKLDTATLISSDEVLPDVVTMNSTVRLCDSRSSYEDTYRLVFPEYVGVAENILSVLIPLGTAILCNRVGDLVRWPVPSGMLHLRIKELIAQPERDTVFFKHNNSQFHTSCCN